MDYKEFKRKVEDFKTLFAEAKSGHIEMVILDLINEFSPNFMEYKAKEMIEECDFDHDTVVRSHFKRLLWNEIVEESRKETTVFKTDEEIIAELNSSVFTDKHPEFVPMPKNTEALYEEQMKKMMAGIPLHGEGCDCYVCFKGPGA
jgi:hypothetical protein